MHIQNSEILYENDEIIQKDKIINILLIVGFCTDMFNYILRSRLIRKPIKKNQNFINVSNPPKIIDRNNMIINSTPSKSSPQFEVISDNESANDNNKTNKYMNINYHFKQKDLESKTRSENSDDILKMLKLLLILH